MPITPIVSSENIEGNIGQCQTTTSMIGCAERINIFICQDVGYATNSCTGQVEKFQTWSPSGISWIAITILAVAVAILVFRGITKIFD